MNVLVFRSELDKIDGKIKALHRERESLIAERQANCKHEDTQLAYHCEKGPFEAYYNGFLCLNCGLEDCGWTSSDTYGRFVGSTDPKTRIALSEHYQLGVRYYK